LLRFAIKLQKKLPRVLCRKFKHTAPIWVHNDKIIMYQFIKNKNIKKIVLQMRDLKILQKFGWRFVYIIGSLSHDFINTNAVTCVNFTKAAIGLKKPAIQTPLALYKYLTKY
jgi:hypothetical protein